MAKKMFEIECSLPAYYGYCYYHSGLKLINRLYIKNFYRKSVTGAYITITSTELLIDYKKDIELLPYERTLDIDITDIELNPQVLIDNDSKKIAKILVRLYSGGVLCENIYNITLLPYHSYPGVMAAAELLACFVKPLKENYKLLKSASDLMRGIKLSQMVGGYQGKSKDDIRLIAESVYRSVQNKKIENIKQSGIENPFIINFTDTVVAEKKATLIETACMFASCLEACGFNSAVAVNFDECLLGIWLTDNCFLDSAFDDITELKKRSDSIIDDIAVIDIKKLFENGTFSDAEKSASLIIAKNGGSFYTIIDIKRCRIANYYPLPLRKKSAGGYEVIQEERNKQDDEMPQIKKVYKQLKLKPLPSKESQWERRLLDLSLKNRLLNFKPKSAIQIMSVSLSDTAQKLLSKKQYSLFEMPSEFSSNLSSKGSFDTPPKIKPLAQLISLEQKNGRMRTFLDNKSLSTSLGTLYRKEKTSVEETGTSALYAACGFLKWNYSEDKNNYKYAPLLLIPVTLEKKQGGKGFGVVLREDEYSFNITLLEFLKQEFGIEMRGTANLKDISDIESTFAAVKKMILSFKGWEVTEDVYIASLSYSSFLMWNDIHTNIETFKKNKIIYSLTQNKLEPSLLKYYSAEDFDRKDKETVYLPLSADNSQYKALRLSDKNVSFVLHGPPGTGKSQTITNIIANAIAKNKRVLFVAQKLAALSVVKKRLDLIGIGDFCLELHSLKTAKNEVCKRLLDTAALKANKETDFKNKLKELKDLKETLKKPVKKLHKTRRLGISIYQGIINVIENKNISDDLMKIDSVFYDKLTSERLIIYENLLKQLVAVSKECGQIYRSPYENVGITQYDRSLKKRIENASKI
ncbi:MAG: DUF4011 domain-containing protein, partial [Clostridia bacterium]|nr:DUF4011 domain-containing protein [Clostridia bacterium]